jgi:ABC-type sugar transport system ATPase subunit
MKQPYLRMVGIRKRFPGVQALAGVDLEVDAGEVLAVVGANGAGKTTLMNILGGVVQPDDGEIYICGKRADIRSPLDAAACGIAFVHQELALLPTMSVVDNMYVASFPSRGGFIDYRTAEDRCARILDALKCGFHPRTTLQELNPGDRQMVEIARALLAEPRLIIFDEPTSSLTSREKRRLFGVISALKQAGVAVIYITHLLDEVFDICDRAVVLRNGETVGGGPIRSLTRDRIVELMIGANVITQHSVRKTKQIGEPLLEVEGLEREGVLTGISFSLHRGEIVGVWGLLGSGRTEVARAIAGLDPIDRGSIRVSVGGVMKTIQAGEARNWIGMIPENRREEALLLPQSVKANMSLANLRALLSRIWPLVDVKREACLAQEYVKRLGIAASSIEQPVATLSGGNQQKVIVGRWLQRKPLIYIMDEPTRGIDVGAKAQICNIICELADGGAAIMLISSDIDEMIALSDRFLVMSRGRITSELPGGSSKDRLMAAAMGYSFEEDTTCEG